MAHDHTRRVGDQASARHKGPLLAAIFLVGGFLLVELVVGLAAGSLSLISDAGHMLSDLVTLVIAAVASRLASRPDRSGDKTFGSYRLEIFAAGLAVLIMFATAVYIIIEAISRFSQGHDHVLALPILIVGAAGLLLNIAVMLILRAGSQESLNLKAAYIEVLGDAIGSVGIIIGSVLIFITGLVIFDTLVALGLAIFIVVRGVMLGREVLHVLLQHAPEGISTERVRESLLALPGVSDVHDLHIWTLTSGMHIATLHFILEEGADHHRILDQADELMRTRYSIPHSTFQIDPKGHVDVTKW